MPVPILLLFPSMLQLDSLCTSNDFVNDVCAALPFSTYILQSVAQPNPIKWLLMNFQQVLSPGSACTTLHCPLTLQSIHVSHGSAYHLSSLVFLGHAKCLFVTLFLCCSFSFCCIYFCVLKTSSGNVLHWSCSQLNDFSLSHIIFLHVLVSNKLNLVLCPLIFSSHLQACNNSFVSLWVTFYKLVAMKNYCH